MFKKKLHFTFLFFFCFFCVKGCIITENICEFCSISALDVLGEGNRNDKILKCHFVQK